MGEGTVLVGEAVGQADPGQDIRWVCVAGSVMGNSNEGRKSQFTQGSWGPICRGQRWDKDGSGNPVLQPQHLLTSCPIHLTQKPGNLSLFSQPTFRGQDSALHMLPLPWRPPSLQSQGF